MDFDHLREYARTLYNRQQDKEVNSIVRMLTPHRYDIRLTEFTSTKAIIFLILAIKHISRTVVENLPSSIISLKFELSTSKDNYGRFNNIQYLSANDLATCSFETITNYIKKYVEALINTNSLSNIHTLKIDLVAPEVPKPIEYPKALMTSEMQEAVDSYNNSLKERVTNARIEAEKVRLQDEHINYSDRTLASAMANMANRVGKFNGKEMPVQCLDECGNADYTEVTLTFNIPKTITVTPAKVNITIEPINTIKLT